MHSLHGHYSLQKPIEDHERYKRLTKALLCFQGTQHKHAFPIQRDLVVGSLQYTTKMCVWWAR